MPAEDAKKHIGDNAVDENINSLTLDTPDEKTAQKPSNSCVQTLPAENDDSRFQEEQQEPLDLRKKKVLKEVQTNIQYSQNGEEVSHEFRL